MCLARRWVPLVRFLFCVLGMVAACVSRGAEYVRGALTCSGFFSSVLKEAQYGGIVLFTGTKPISLTNYASCPPSSHSDSGLVFAPSEQQCCHQDWAFLQGSRYWKELCTGQIHPRRSNLPGSEHREKTLWTAVLLGWHVEFSTGDRHWSWEVRFEGGYFPPSNRALLVRVC